MSDTEKGSKQAGSDSKIVEPVVVGHAPGGLGPEHRADMYNELVDAPPEGEVERVLDLTGNRPRIAWGIPFDEINYSSWTIHMLAERMVQSGDDLIATESTYVVTARNFIHEAYVNQATQPYLMMVDSDVLIPRGGVEKLLELSEKYPDAVISGWYHKKKVGDAVPVVYRSYDKQTNKFNHYLHDEIKDLFLKGKTTRVAAVGIGCMLMPRSVAEALGDKPYEYHSAEQALGEDMKLGRTLAGLKIDIRVHWPLLCKHIGVGVI